MGDRCSLSWVRVEEYGSSTFDLMFGFSAPPAGFESARTAPEAGPVHGCYLAKLARASRVGSVWGVRSGRLAWRRGALVFPGAASMARAAGGLAGAY